MPVYLTIDLDCLDPVSYTHLDVYKRQTLNNLPNYLGVSDNLDTVIEYIMARDITTLPAGRTRIDGDKVVAVSYTHLDVYKRQDRHPDQREHPAGILHGRAGQRKRRGAGSGFSQQLLPCLLYTSYFSCKSH